MIIEPVFKAPVDTGSGKDKGVRRKSKKNPRPVKHQGIEPRQFVRKAFYVSGVQVTENNIHEVAKWCGGSIQENGEGQLYIRVHTTKAMYDRQTQARPGDWVLKAGKSWKVYTNKAFNDVFEAVDAERQKEVEEVEEVEDADPLTTLPPEAKEVLLLIAEQIKEAAS